MPYPNEHAARVKEPSEFGPESFRRKTIATGIDVILGKLKGESSMTIQAYRFDTDEFTPPEAKDWLAEHKVEYIRFEPADDTREGAAPNMSISEGKELEEHPDRFSTKMLDRPITRDNFVHMEGGALKVMNIVALAEGEWTDSAVGTPLFYPARVLEADYGKWVAPGIWSRHMGGGARSITDKVGIVKNPRYDPEQKAVLVDGIFHGKTQASRDVIELIENEIVTDVSAEVGGKEVWNPESKRYEAASLAFYGLATVDRGACNVCKMKRNEAAECQLEEERKEMETKELEQKLTALEAEKAEFAKVAEAEKAELTKQLEAANKSRADEQAASTAATAELTRKLAEAAARITELEKTPATPITKPGNGSTPTTPDIQLEVITPARVYGGEVSRA